MNRYSTIMNLSHHVSVKHVPMPMYKRAAQFSSFDALTGFDECIEEKARLTDSMKERTEDEIDELNTAMARLLESESSEVEILYFKHDERKAGGRYVTYRGVFRRLDREQDLLLFRDKTALPLQSIARIMFV